MAGINRDGHSGDSAAGLTKSWDGQALRKQVAAGAQITATLSQQAHEAISDYMQDRLSHLAQKKENASPEQLQQIEAERKQLRTEKEMLNVLVSAVTGYGAEGLTQAAVAKAADYMRDQMKADSSVS